jgi:hypothetical protein
MGKKVFMRFLKSYASRFAFRQATPGDLFKKAVAATKKKAKVKALIQRWIRESHGDTDIGTVDFSDLDRLINQLSSMQATGNVRFDGPVDPAILRLFQQAVRQLSGP